MIYRDRRHAGRELAARLGRYSGRDDVLVLALPRGGVPVAFEVAQALQVPLDVFLVRKLGVPGHEELAMGAIASGGVRVLNQRHRGPLGIDTAVDRRGGGARADRTATARAGLSRAIAASRRWPARP